MASAERNRYVDLLRLLAIVMVVYGHWLLVSITYKSGQLSGVNAIDYISWGAWVTLVFQVMPVFFFVGGYVNARSWPSHQARGETWTVWVRNRALRLLWPTAVFVAVGVLAVSAALLAGVPGTTVGLAAWVTVLHLWFLPVYLLLAALTPALFAAHRRWGLWVAVVMAAGRQPCGRAPRRLRGGTARHLLHRPSVRHGPSGELGSCDPSSADPGRQLPPADPGHQHIAELARRRLSRAAVPGSRSRRRWHPRKLLTV